MEKDNRDILVKTYLNKKEAERLDYLCEKTQKGKSSLMRFLLWATVLKEAPHVDYPAVLRKLRKIGTDVEKLIMLAKKKNGITDEEFRECMMNLKNTEDYLIDCFTVKEGDNVWQ